MTIDSSQLATNGFTNPADLVGKTLEISDGPGLNRFWLIMAVNTGSQPQTLVLTLKNPAQPATEWGLPTDQSKYAITNLSTNFFANEADQVDSLTVYNDGDTTGQTGTLTSTHLGGLGMTQGIDLAGLEQFELFLGSGNDHLDVTGIPTRPDGFQTVTMINTGAGNDTVNVSLDAASGGLFALNTDAGNDTIDASGSTLPLVLFGGEGNDSITGGQGNDIIFGDNGQVDYRNEQGVLVTRLGLGLHERVTLNPGQSESSSLDVPTHQTDGVVRSPSFITTRASISGNDTIIGNLGDDSLFGGVGSDQIYGDAQTSSAQDGNDVIFGDNGSITVSSTGVTISTSDTSVGSTDTIQTGNGNNTVFGGAGGDSITGGTGNDVILGDFGTISLANGQLSSVATTDPTVGGNDTISGGANSDIIFGGAGADSITGDDGNDVILGDMGLVRVSGGLVNYVTTTDTADGGNDTISGGSGDDIVLGGAGADSITGDDGNDILLGDFGWVLYLSPGTPYAVFTSNWTYGGNDTISGGSGDDVVFGGFGDDSLSGDDGNDVLVGDFGIAFLGSQVMSTNTTFGGNDTISGGAGNDIAIGGFGADLIYGNSDDDVLLGDSGMVRFGSGQYINVSTLDPATGGNDTISGGSGNDIIMGGAGDDTILGGADHDVIFGDTGVVGLVSGVVSYAQTVNPSIGGNDTIDAGTGNDEVFGGTGADSILGNDGSDVLLGDLGSITYNAGIPSHVTTSDTGIGANDWISGGAGADAILGGYGDDTISGDAGNDMILGDFGTLTFSGGKLSLATTSDITGGNDLISGGDDNDTVLGGFGSDTISGDAGNDTLLGDYGRVTFANGVAMRHRDQQSDPGRVGLNQRRRR